MQEGKRIYLRQVVFEDCQVLLEWENNPENWEVSGTKTPFSEEEIIDFIVEQANFRDAGQLRLMICISENSVPIGAVDLFDIDEEKGTAGVGILIDRQENRRKGYASDALDLLKAIAKSLFSLNRLNCTIHSYNIGSIRLFEKSGFRLAERNIKPDIDQYTCRL